MYMPTAASPVLGRKSSEKRAAPPSVPCSPGPGCRVPGRRSGCLPAGNRKEQQIRLVRRDLDQHGPHVQIPTLTAPWNTTSPPSSSKAATVMAWFRSAIDAAVVNLAMVRAPNWLKGVFGRQPPQHAVVVGRAVIAVLPDAACVAVGICQRRRLWWRPRSCCAGARDDGHRRGGRTGTGGAQHTNAAGLAITLVAAVWPPSALHSESSEMRRTGWPWISPEFGQRNRNGVGRVLSQVGVGSRQHHHRRNRHRFVGGHGNAADTVPALQGILIRSLEGAVQPAARTAHKTRKRSQMRVRNEVMG